MEQDSKQESSLKKTVNILAEMTRKDIQRLNNFIKISPPMKAPTSYPPSKEL
jgi:hypothetical protein